MANTKIMFETEHNDAYFQGRNGMGKCRGVDFWLNEHTSLVLIEPFTSKGNVANCTITFPASKLDDVIAVLTSLRDAQKNPKKEGK